MDNGDATLLDIPNSRLLLRSLQTQEEFPITGQIIVGRAKECKIHLDDISISRQHAKVTAIAGSVFVEDLNSTNGTSVNGQKINAPQQVAAGDEIHFHKYAFQLAMVGSEGTEATMLDAAPVRAAAVEAKIEVEAAAPKLAPSSSDDIDVEGADEALHSRRDPTQVMSRQKLKALAKRGAMPKNVVTAGSGSRLVILSAPLRGKVIPLPDDLSPGTQLNIGRGGHSNKLNIMLDDKTVSQDHAKLELKPHGWTIKATNARNGLSINGEQTTRSVLQHDDTVTIGRIELAFLTDEGDDSQPENIQDEVNDNKPKGRRVSKIIMFILVLIAILLAALFALPIVE
ncbi:MAG: FHA domain-containing protein [Pseudomonadales bacterium]